MFSVPRGCPKIKYVAFADDVVIFTNGSRASINKLMQFISVYEAEFGHSVNKENRCFVLCVMCLNISR